MVLDMLRAYQACPNPKSRRQHTLNERGLCKYKERSVSQGVEVELRGTRVRNECDQIILQEAESLNKSIT